MARLVLCLRDLANNGVVHRDIKLENILVDSDDKPYLADFGQVCFSRADKVHVGRRLYGTHAYMAPETKESSFQFSSASDVYSMGVVFSELRFKVTVPDEE